MTRTRQEEKEKRCLKSLGKTPQKRKWTEWVDMQNFRDEKKKLAAVAMCMDSWLFEKAMVNEYKVDYYEDVNAGLSIALERGLRERVREGDELLEAQAENVRLETDLNDMRLEHADQTETIRAMQRRIDILREICAGLIDDVLRDQPSSRRTRSERVQDIIHNARVRRRLNYSD